MSDDGLLRRLKHYISQDNVKLKMAAIYCISNLAWSTDEGASERQTVFRDLGILKLLQDLSTTADPLLFDRWDIMSIITQYVIGNIVKE